MSQILRLQKTLCLVRDISVKGQIFGNILRESKGRGYSSSSKESTLVKAAEGHAKRRRWKKRKSYIYKNKVEGDLFKLLNARTTQLALEALQRESGETDTKWTSHAIVVVPETSSYSEVKDIGHLLEPMSRTASDRQHQLVGAEYTHSVKDGKNRNITQHEWNTMVDSFSKQFVEATDVDEKDFRNSDSSNPLDDVSHSSSLLHDINQSNACAAYSSDISSLSDEIVSESLDSSQRRDSGVSVNANILKHKQLRKVPERNYVKLKSVSEELVDDVISSDKSEGMNVIPDDFLDTSDVKQSQAKTTEQKSSNTKQKEKSKEKSAEKNTKPVMSEKNKSKWNKIFNQDLRAYVDACCFSGLLSMAQSTIRFYHHSKDKTSAMRAIQDVSIYNTLMHAWAKQGNIDRIKELFSFMRKDGLAPSLQSYAACFECLNHQKVFDAALGEKIVQDMQKEGLDVKDIFNECTFKGEERQSVLETLKKIEIEFEPRPPPSPTPYTGPLLEALNHRLSDDQVVERNPYEGVLTADQMVDRMKTQLDLELRGAVTVESIAKKSVPTKRMKAYREKVKTLQEDWSKLFIKSMERKLRYSTKQNKGEHGLTLFPYLKLFPPHEYAECMMCEMEKVAMSSDTFSPSKSVLWKQLGLRIYRRYSTQDKINNHVSRTISQLYEQYTTHYCDEDFAFLNHRECWQQLMKTQVTSVDDAEKTWPNHILKGIGKMLYDIILYDVKIDLNMLKNTPEKKMVPAFYSVYRSYGTRTSEEIKPNPVLVRLYQGAALDDLTFDTSDLPMLCPPVPWVSQHHGGSLLCSSRLIRLPDQAQNQTERLDQIPTQQMYSVLDSLNTLGACAWVINKPMLDLIIGIFNNKGMKELDIPPPASDCRPSPKINKDMTSKEKAQVHQERMKVRQEKSEMYSLWCSELYRLSIANKYRDDVFWFPHNMDFRGRTYPCPPHFNHLGSDVARSVLQFAKGKPLGETGLDWLKIHLVNLTGFKKRTSNKERLEFANDIMSDILDSADNPLEGNKWWQGSDEPWQTLACCKEIANAVRSPDPTQYVCHFPVHQDGSCNGLQHYAALGRDQAGAESVNLFPFAIPQDVYSDVAELVEKVREREAEEGDEIAQVLEGFVRRKVIKQTVMTTVYGVTKYGAKYQIQRQLKDIPEFPQDQVWAASSYLTQKTFQCLREMFTATKEIQDWLTMCAHLISTVRNKPVEWLTPLGLLVIQPYHKPMSLTRFGISVTDNWNNLEKPNAIKQKNGFPPNFIHSLDSTHMMLTSLYCLRAGITYVSVHDCFWTHPTDVKVMNRVCREQFVSLHRQPILEDLSRYLQEQFVAQNINNSSEENILKAEEFLHSVLKQVPPRGTFDLDNVLKSTFFFS